MAQYVIAYLVSAAVFLGIDFVWLSYASRAFYRPRLGDLLAETPNLTVAALFYCIYVVGIVVFAVMPAFAARSLVTAAASGALLGLVAYGTYDFTNLATLRGWPISVTIVDVLWGVLLTAAAATSGYLALKVLNG